MSVILHPRDFNRWFDRDSDPSRPSIDLLRPFPAEEMEAFEVSNYSDADSALVEIGKHFPLKT